MKGLSKKVCGAALMGLLLASESLLAINMADVQVTQWFGSGSKQALMVVDWQEPQTVVFGYRWDGTATGLDFMNAVNDANVGFTRVWHPSYVGATVFGMGFDIDGDGGSFVSGTPGFTTETGYATDAADYYAEGWYVNGYWAFYVSQDAEQWGYASEGLAHQLTDGGWDGWSWSPAPTWDGGVPNNIPLVPEPATALMLLAAAGMVLRRRVGK
jgi:hypothetical protein